MRGSALSGTALSLCLAGAAHGAVTVEDPGAYVVDTAGLVEAATERRMEGWLRELEQKTTAQVKVLTVPTTDGEDFFGFVQRHAEAWKLGRKGEDNGALIVLAVEERRVRIHTGYGLEGTLPDSWAGSASRQAAAEFFRAGRYAEGLLFLTVATANRVADAAGVELSGVPAHRVRGGGRGRMTGAGVGSALMPLLVLLFFLGSLRRRRHRSAWGGRGAASGFLMSPSSAASWEGATVRGAGRWAVSAVASEAASGVPSAEAAASAAAEAEPDGDPLHGSDEPWTPRRTKGSPEQRSRSS